MGLQKLAPEFFQPAQPFNLSTLKQFWNQVPLQYVNSETCMVFSVTSTVRLKPNVSDFTFCKLI